MYPIGDPVNMCQALIVCLAWLCFVRLRVWGFGLSPQQKYADLSRELPLVQIPSPSPAEKLR